MRTFKVYTLSPGDVVKTVTIRADAVGVENNQSLSFYNWVDRDPDSGGDRRIKKLAACFTAGVWTHFIQTGVDS